MEPSGIAGIGELPQKWKECAGSAPSFDGSSSCLALMASVVPQDYSPNTGFNLFEHIMQVSFILYFCLFCQYCHFPPPWILPCLCICLKNVKQAIHSNSLIMLSFFCVDHGL